MLEFKKRWSGQKIEHHSPPLVTVVLEDEKEDSGKYGWLVEHKNRIHKKPPVLYFTVRSQGHEGVLST